MEMCDHSYYLKVKNSAVMRISAFGQRLRHIATFSDKSLYNINRLYIASLYFIGDIQIMDQTNKKVIEEASTEFNEESVSLLLETAKAEYNNEHNRTSIIDSKTNISLPIISTFVLALIQLNDYKAILQLPTNTFLQWLLPAILFFSYTIALGLGVFSVLLMTIVILTKEYAVLKISDLYDEDYLKVPRIFFSIELIRLYHSSTTQNKSQNDRRVKWYRISWILMFITLALYLIYKIIKTNL